MAYNDLGIYAGGFCAVALSVGKPLE